MFNEDGGDYEREGGQGWEDHSALFYEERDAPAPSSYKYTSSNANSAPPPRKKRTVKTEESDLIDQSMPDIQSFLDNPKLIHKEKKENGVNCRACKKGYFVRKDSSLVKSIGTLIRQYSYSISLTALIDEIYIIGEAERRRMIADGEEDPGEWTEEEIEYHLFNCMTDPGLLCLKQLTDLKGELVSLHKHLWKMNSDGVREPDKNVFGLYFATQSQIKQFLTLKPETTVSFNPRLNVQVSSRKTTRER